MLNQKGILNSVETRKKISIALKGKMMEIRILFSGVGIRKLLRTEFQRRTKGRVENIPKNQKEKSVIGIEEKNFQRILEKT